MTFTCPICNYQGEFNSFRGRIHARCPQCLGLERHRFQFALVKPIFTALNADKKSILHFAPENAFRKIFTKMFKDYQCADLYMDDVDHKVDIQKLPFPDQSFDVVYASHVLEHIRDDIKALSEIHRVLKADGIAILPVPIMGLETIEYDIPDPLQDNHVRAPGIDYFDRYKSLFRVEIFESSAVPEHYQPYAYAKDDSKSPFLNGNDRITDFIPICHKL